MFLLLLACAAHQPATTAAPTPVATAPPVQLTPPAQPAPAAEGPSAAAAPAAPPAAPPVAAASNAGGVIGQEGAPVKHVHWSEVQQKLRINPTFPPEAAALGAEAECLVQITLGPTGHPTSVEAPSCPDLFRDAALKAAGGSAWYPYKVDGVAVPVVFTMLYHFKASSP